jgi:hypothetical protein
MMGASYEPTLHDMKLCFVEDAFQPEMKTKGPRKWGSI